MKQTKKFKEELKELNRLSEIAYEEVEREAIAVEKLQLQNKKEIEVYKLLNSTIKDYKHTGAGIGLLVGAFFIAFTYPPTTSLIVILAFSLLVIVGLHEWISHSPISISKLIEEIEKPLEDYKIEGPNGSEIQWD